MGLQDFVRWFLPKESHFYDYLEKQSRIAREGALAFAAFKETTASAADVRARVQACEHEGDDVVHQMEEALAKTFVTPIDREDLQKLSKELDDVLDLTNGAARACDLYGIERPTTPMLALIDILVRSTEILDTAVPKLRQHAYGELIAASREMRKLEKDGDALFREAISRLFHDARIDAKNILREKEVLEDIETAIDYCERVAGTLANLAVKLG